MESYVSLLLLLLLLLEAGWSVLVEYEGGNVPSSCWKTYSSSSSHAAKYAPLLPSDRRYRFPTKSEGTVVTDDDRLRRNAIGLVAMEGTMIPLDDDDDNDGMSADTWDDGDNSLCADNPTTIRMMEINGA